MKKIILGIILLGWSLQMFAQNDVFEVDLYTEELPETITEALEANYPDFTVVEVKAIPAEPSLGIRDEDAEYEYIEEYETYEVDLSGTGMFISLVYDKAGDLLSEKEYIESVALPLAIKKTIETEYPEWNISKNVYKMKRQGDSPNNERYRLTLSDGEDTKRVVCDANGRILNHIIAHEITNYKKVKKNSKRG